MNKDQMCDIFINFLNDNDADAFFILNLGNYESHGSIRKYFNKLSEEGSAITVAFPWNCTDQGDDYWRALSIEWRAIVAQLKKSSTKKENFKSIW